MLLRLLALCLFVFPLTSPAKVPRALSCEIVYRILAHDMLQDYFYNQDHKRIDTLLLVDTFRRFDTLCRGDKVFIRFMGELPPGLAPGKETAGLISGRRHMAMLILEKVKPRIGRGYLLSFWMASENSRLRFAVRGHGRHTRIKLLSTY